ncbi:MAG: tRNA pseudouridine(13) synthase TruD [Myxococcales bacterium]|nr:tRNA pseudouridine(13) synthase TruD [Myxococcales bacterium]MCB9626920.1 tRNA pseudouridine(13) synthase TruD [Sandaracinaceae bacterium]
MDSSPRVDPTLSLPYATAAIPPTGGTLRAHPDDFVVEEVPAYAPSGTGDHLFVRIRKVNRTTPDAVRELSRALGVDERAAGYAGLKDRQATTTQWVSLFGADANAALALALPDIEVLEAIPHSSKLRTGHLHGNRFTLRVRDAADADLEAVRAAAAQLVSDGLPNYFGAQRFGRDFDNALRARAWMKGEARAPKAPFERKMLVSALQSELFNHVVAERVSAGELGRIRPGELVQKHTTGGMFVVEDVAEAQARADAWELSATGPMFGTKMRRAEREAGEREAALLARHDISEEDLSRIARWGEGTRRYVRVMIPSIEVEPAEGGYRVSFTLPKGSYATVVMRELMKVALPPL